MKAHELFKQICLLLLECPSERKKLTITGMGRDLEEKFWAVSIAAHE